MRTITFASLLLLFATHCGASHELEPDSSRPPSLDSGMPGDAAAEPDVAPPPPPDCPESGTLPPPVLMSPVAGARLNTGEPIFVVDTGCGDGTWLDVCADPECSTRVADGSAFGGPVLEVRVDRVLEPGRYYWRASVLSRRHSSAPSAARELIIEERGAPAEVGGSDFDGDGLADVLSTGPMSPVDALHVSYGRADGEVPRSDAVVGGCPLFSSSWLRAFSAVGDVDADGYDDAALYCHCNRACEDDADGMPQDTLTLFLGSADGLGVREAVVHHIPSGGRRGSAPRIFPLGDTDADGRADFALWRSDRGLRRFDGAEASAARSFAPVTPALTGTDLIVGRFLPGLGTVRIDGARLIVATLDGGDVADLGLAEGADLERLGDVDGDGYDDFANWTRPTDALPDDASVRVFFGGLEGRPGPLLEDVGGPARFGQAITAAGDLDEDGYDDFVVASPDLLTGVLNAYFGNADGEFHLERFTLRARHKGLGRDLASPGDTNGDGRPDLVATALACGLPTSDCPDYGDDLGYGAVEGMIFVIEDVPQPAGYVGWRLLSESVGVVLGER